MNTIQVITNGDKQTVILPKEFQLQGNEIYIKKIGNAVVLFSKENAWQTLFDSLNIFSEDFMENREQPDIEEKEAIE
ncbi:MAG: type II toxin-antitoxin system VapB family antitoxin [Scytonema sp. PMC 1070.18]|nr:type II toxin-antitoxin system VapB family antitoxin [Scytonema sp. PMC 1070.18]